MKRGTVLLLLAIACGAALADAPAAQHAGAAVPAGSAGRGAQVYASAGCVACHGPRGAGGTALRLVPVPPAYAVFVKAVRQPSGAMPAYPPQAVSDAQLADLYAFLRSLGPARAASAAPPAPSSTDTANGKRLYNATGCYSCHGYVGQGGSAGPKIGPAPISFPAFLAALRQPRQDMPPYTAKVISDAEVADIYAYVQTFPVPPKADSLPLLKQ